jgi:hypothetical protein
LRENPDIAKASGHRTTECFSFQWDLLPVLGEAFLRRDLHGKTFPGELPGGITASRPLGQSAPDFPS